MRTYATASEIRDEITDLHSIRQGHKETEIELSSRLNTSAYRCGKLFNDGEKMKLYVYSLLPKIRTVVARYREDQSRSTLTLKTSIQYTQDEVEEYRALAGNSSGGSRTVLKTVNINGRTVTVREPSSSRGTLLYLKDSEELYQVEENISTDLLPSNETSEDQLFQVREGRDNERRIFRPPHGSCVDKHTTRAHSGWINS